MYDATEGNNEHSCMEACQPSLQWHAGKLLAFSGPSNIARVYYGFKSFTPDDYCDYFRQRGVTAVVRLNKPVSALSMRLAPLLYLVDRSLQLCNACDEQAVIGVLLYCCPCCAQRQTCVRF